MVTTEVELPKPMQAGGFELFLPSTPFPRREEAKKDNFARLLMIDDLNRGFYDIYYENPLLKNTKSWIDLEIHKFQEPAILIGPLQLQRLRADPKVLESRNEGYPLATGHLVSIVSRTNGIFTAELLGAVNIVPLQEDKMNWDLLKEWKQEELVIELQNGLLRRVWDKKGSQVAKDTTYATRASTLNTMSRRWYDDGKRLNHELDGRVIGAATIEPNQVWQLVPEGWKASEVR